MKNTTTGNKILGIIVGIIYIGFGFFVMSQPAATLISISLVVGWTLLIGGVILIVDSFRIPGLPHLRSSLLIEGILVLVLGLIFLLGSVERDVKILSYLLLFWFIATSAIQIQFALEMEKLWAKALVIVLNLFVIGYSIWFLFNPAAAAGLLVITIAILFISSGVNRILTAL